MSVEKKSKRVLFQLLILNNNNESKKKEKEQKSDSSLVLSFQDQCVLRCVSVCKSLVFSTLCVPDKRKHQPMVIIICVYHVAKDVVMKRTKTVKIYGKIHKYAHLRVYPHSSHPPRKKRGGGGNDLFFYFLFFSSFLMLNLLQLISV